MKRFWTSVLVVTAVLITGGCSRETLTPVAPQPPVAPAFVLHTARGPVDVLSFEDKQGGRRMRVHAVRENGRHAVRDITVRGRWVEPGLYEFVAVISHESRTTFKMTHRRLHGEPRYLDMILETEREALAVRTRAQGAGTEIHVESRTPVSVLGRTILAEPFQLNDPDWTRTTRMELAGLYPGGPALDHEDRVLLEAVLESPDWRIYLSMGDSSDPEFKKRMEKVCVAASAVSLITCTVAPFLPPAWVACVPATGVQIACLVYQIQQILTEDETPCPCACLCDERPPIKE